MTCFVGVEGAGITSPHHEASWGHQEHPQPRELSSACQKPGEWAACTMNWVLSMKAALQCIQYRELTIRLMNVFVLV
jgi:hypothetical protein